MSATLQLCPPLFATLENAEEPEIVREMELFEMGQKREMELFEMGQKREMELFEMAREREMLLFKQKQTKKWNSKYNEFNNADASVINSHYHDDTKRYKNILKRMLTLYDFVNSGSYGAKYSTLKEQKKFVNMLCLNILENMVEDEEIKVKPFGKFKYYYTRLSDGEVENMSEEEIRSRLFQKQI
jgi:nucleoid DNA-binding protein